MDVLQLVTTRRPFFDQQLEALEQVGVRCRTLPIHHMVDDQGRSVLDYLRYAPQSLGEAVNGFDVIHANHGLTAPYALAQPNRPVVVTFWGSELLGRGSPLERLVGATSQMTARLADEVILPSPAMAEALQTEHTLIPFGVDTDRFRPIPRAEARERVGWADAGRVVLFPADPDRPEKDFQRAQRVVDGTGASLRTLSSAPHREMPYYLNASDAVLVTSRHESGPMVVKEAAACNVPVVSTDVGFVSEVLDGVTNSAVCDNSAGLSVVLERILESDRRSDGRDAISGVDLEDMGRQLRRVYEQSLEGR